MAVSKIELIVLFCVCLTLFVSTAKTLQKNCESQHLFLNFLIAYSRCILVTNFYSTCEYWELLEYSKLNAISFSLARAEIDMIKLIFDTGVCEFLFHCYHFQLAFFVFWPDIRHWGILWCKNRKCWFIYRQQ